MMVYLLDRRVSNIIWGINIIYCEHNFQFDNHSEKSVIHRDLLLGYMLFLRIAYT